MNSSTWRAPRYFATMAQSTAVAPPPTIATLPEKLNAFTGSMRAVRVTCVQTARPPNPARGHMHALTLLKTDHKKVDALVEKFSREK
mgnify:CR=1 FL=1